MNAIIIATDFMDYTARHSRKQTESITEARWDSLRRASSALRLSVSARDRSLSKMVREAAQRRREDGRENAQKAQKIGG